MINLQHIGGLGRVLRATALAVSLTTLSAAAANHPPTLGLGNDLYVQKNASTNLNYTDLVALTGAFDPDADAISLIVDQVQNGSATVNGVAVVAGVTRIESGDVFTWTAPTGAYNTYVEAFRLKAFDAKDYSAGPVQIGASIRGNNAPELTFVEPLNRENLLNAHKNEAYAVNVSALKDHSDLRDMDDDVVSFAIDSVTAGTLLLDGQPVVTRAIVTATSILTWLPPENVSGRIVAFKVLGFDGTDLSATAVPVTIEVTDPMPHFVKGANQSVLRDDFGQWVENWASAIGPDEYALHFEVSNDNPELFLSAPEISDTGTLIYMVAPSAFGQANVRVVLADDQGHHSDAQTFSINVALVNYAPEFSLPEVLTVDEDQGTQRFPGFATSISAGENESFQTVAFSVAVTNASLYSVKPSITADGTLAFKTATNAFGQDLVTVTLTDNGRTANGGQNATAHTFVLNVIPQNDAPTLSLKSLVVNEDSDVTTAIGFKDIDSSNAELSLKVAGFDRELISVAETLNENGNWTLRVVPAANAVGKTTVTLVGSDGETSTTFPIAVTINPVNDAPSFELSRTSVVTDFAGQVVSLSHFVKNISPGATNESTQLISFEVVPVNPSFFATKPTIAADGTLKFKVADGMVGSNLVTVVVHDNGGVLNGGTNVSAAKTFYVVSPSNPFPEWKGMYSGLFFESSAVTLGRSGAVTATVTDKGAYSGKLQLAGASYTFKGQLSLSGHSSTTIARVGKTPLRLDLVISGDGITGAVSDGTWNATIAADKAIYSASNVAPQAGKYTISFSSEAAHPAVATITVTAAGVASGVINFADGTILNTSGVMTTRGQVAIYSSLYSGTGSVLGWLTFTNTDSANLQGTLSYIRQSSATVAGFTNQLQAVGAVFGATEASRSFVATRSANASFSGAGLNGTLNIGVTLGANNIISASGYGLVLKMSALNGLVTGTFVHPVTKAVVTVKGVMLQRSNQMSGFIVSRKESGSFDWQL